MNPGDIRRIIVDELSNIAPETDPSAIDPSLDVREALDIDSMDFLNFVIALHERLQVDIPESDYAQLRTIDGAVDYLAKKGI